MKISQEFSKNASYYEQHNTIQKLVINKLLTSLNSEPKNILDLGCGSGAVCSSINWEYNYFSGVDFAQGMLQLHPKSDKIECIFGDFNDSLLFEKLRNNRYDQIFSASALQWASDLEETFLGINSLNAPVSLAIFTSGTFKNLLDTAAIDSLLMTKEEVDRLQKKYFNAKYEVVEYRLEFSSVREMFRYIKRSGVSGSRNILNFKQMKKLMKEYSLNYLEFEVAFITSL